LVSHRLSPRQVASVGSFATTSACLIQSGERTNLQAKKFISRSTFQSSVVKALQATAFSVCRLVAHRRTSTPNRGLFHHHPPLDPVRLCGVDMTLSVMARAASSSLGDMASHVTPQERQLFRQSAFLADGHIQRVAAIVRRMLIPPNHPVALKHREGSELCSRQLPNRQRSAVQKVVSTSCGSWLIIPPSAQVTLYIWKPPKTTDRATSPAQMTPAARIASDIWRRLGQAELLGARLGEETLTDLLVLDMLPRRMMNAFSIHHPTKQHESLIGADMLLCIRYPDGSGRRLALQAKKLYTTGRYNALGPGTYQTDRLDRFARWWGAVPAYLL